MNDPQFPDTAPHGSEIDDCPPVDACVGVLADAFARESATSWICGSSSATRENWFDATLRADATIPGSRRYALTGDGGRPIAAAVLTPPGARFSPAAQAQWAARTLARCGPRSVQRTLRYLDLTEAGAPESAWTLEFIGVVPGAAGRGAGRRLLDRLLADTSAAAGVYLTTADPGNVALYQHFGFVTQRRLSVGPLNVATMLRRRTSSP
ncbi:GNAT family N-acetyltransferase [Streptomyces atratus]|uniref:GNAT family N-acetyltransferase n=1 Tax=Streptomyces atratus TaxID=1893 RepID=UPI00225B7FA2|nr:GNAT family N-acetyltransferase [Streptomyces atratus]MCX5345400.1 GNAT family N-acetyltransferase [Streptomyces atratus]